MVSVSRCIDYGIEALQFHITANLQYQNPITRSRITDLLDINQFMKQQ